jgi:pyridoxamine 5'-phosphate oxidase family protein
MFTENEIAYIRSQRLARIATVNADGQPDVVPVGYEFDGKDFYVHTEQTARKFKNIAARRNKIALVIDDVVSFDP